MAIVIKFPITYSDNGELVRFGLLPKSFNRCLCTRRMKSNYIIGLNVRVVNRTIKAVYDLGVHPD